MPLSALSEPEATELHQTEAQFVTNRHSPSGAAAPEV